MAGSEGRAYCQAQVCDSKAILHNTQENTAKARNREHNERAVLALCRYRTSCDFAPSFLQQMPRFAPHHHFVFVQLTCTAAAPLLRRQQRLNAELQSSHDHPKAREAPSRSQPPRQQIDLHDPQSAGAQPIASVGDGEINGPSLQPRCTIMSNGAIGKILVAA